MTLEDMAGGTFTISNGGIYGSLMGKSISHFLILRDSYYQFATNGRIGVARYERQTNCFEGTSCDPSYDVFR